MTRSLSLVLASGRGATQFRRTTTTTIMLHREYIFLKFLFTRIIYVYVVYSSSDARQQPRSYQESSTRLSRTSSERDDSHHHRHQRQRPSDTHPRGLRLSVPSDSSHEEMSTGDTSPVSPATPRSATSATLREPQYGFDRVSLGKDYTGKREAYPYHASSVPVGAASEWSHRGVPSREESNPYRPW